MNERGETLLLKRKAKNDIGLWCKPGGRVELGETVEDAVRREIREEVGIEIKLLDYLGFTDQIFVQGGVPMHWVAVHYLAKVVSGEARVLEPEKHDELRWFPLDALPENLTKTTSEPIELYRKRIKKE